MAPAMSDSWKLTLPCTRAEAEALSEETEKFAELDVSPSIVTEEVEAFNDAKWRLIAYFNDKPGAQIIASIRSMIPSADRVKPVIEKLPDEDWLTLSQTNLEPVIAGRFYVHTSTNKGIVPRNAKSFLIEASQAFGTGGHETTSGCLQMMDRIYRAGKRFDHIADIGTGTGLLAFAAMHLWPRAYLTATDIDPVSIDVTVQNALANGIPLGQQAGHLALCSASGTDHEMIQRRALYDLIVANILAGPLIELAPSFAEIILEGGTLILSGLLDKQAGDVARAYRRNGFILRERKDIGDWSCLWFAKRKRYGWARQLRVDRQTSQSEGDYGTW